MREAADWVEYWQRARATLALVKLRRSHGFGRAAQREILEYRQRSRQPRSNRLQDPQEYARAATEFSKVMKRVDPSIKLTGFGDMQLEDFPLGPQFLYRKTEWVERAQLILEQAGDRIDYIALHRYAHPYNRRFVRNPDGIRDRF